MVASGDQDLSQVQLLERRIREQVGGGIADGEMMVE